MPDRVCGAHSMKLPPCIRRRRPCRVLDQVADQVLAYRPKPKSAKARTRQRKRAAAKRRLYRARESSVLVP